MPVTFLGPDFQVNTSANEASGAEVAGLPNGNSVVFWEQDNSSTDFTSRLFGRVFDDAGNPLGSAFAVSTNPNTSVNFSQASALPDGRIFVTWSDRSGSGPDQEVLGRFLSATGTPVGTDFIVTSNRMGDQFHSASTALDDGTVLVSWASRDGTNGSGSAIKARLFASDGTPQGSEFTVSVDALTSHFFPSAATLNDGGFLVTWSTSSFTDVTQIKGRIYNADGTARTGEFNVSPAPASDQRRPQSVVLENGNILVSWQESPDGTFDSSAMAQVITSDGSAVGPAFLISGTGQGSSVSDMGKLPDGRIIVIWERGEQDTEGRILTAEGAVESDVFTINESAGQQSEDAQLTVFDDGRVVVAWQYENPGQGANVQVWGRSFTVDGTGPAPIDGTGAAETLTGTIDADTINGFGGNDVLKGLAGDDVLNGGGGADRLNGGNGADSLFGNAQADILNGGLGNDDLNGGKGGDTLNGQTGNDVVNGGIGNDTLNGGAGNDLLNGGLGRDAMNGGFGNDLVTYRDASAGMRVDLVNSNRNTGEAEGDTYTGIENLQGSDFRDILSGNSGANWMSGGAGNDTIEGRDGADTLRGDIGGDRLVGGNGGDTLLGGSGWDKLEGGNGNDVMRGGGGRDTFVFTAGRDVAEDFTRADRLHLDDVLWTGNLSKSEVLDFADVVGQDTVFDFGAGNTLTLENYTDIADLERLLTLI